jgi:hypothetical protein
VGAAGVARFDEAENVAEMRPESEARRHPMVLARPAGAAQIGFRRKEQSVRVLARTRATRLDFETSKTP